MKVELINNQDQVKLDLKLLSTVSSYISNKFDQNNKNVLNIIFSSTREIKRLNNNYRNINKPTDVLSFSYLSDKKNMNPDDDFYTIGEVYISPEVARDNSKDQGPGWNFNLEIILLIVHGILHIYDYDHKSEEERIEMENVQNSLIFNIRTTFKI